MPEPSLPATTWNVHTFIMRFFVQHERPPAIGETAALLNISAREARDAYQALAGVHELYLEPDGETIRMAVPLSAVETPYRVFAGEHAYYANCAWDSLGIPAMLGTDARVEAHDAYTGDLVHYAVVDGQLRADGGFVHFSLPLRRWFDDLAHT